MCLSVDNFYFVEILSGEFCQKGLTLSNVPLFSVAELMYMCVLSCRYGNFWLALKNGV